MGTPPRVDPNQAGIKTIDPRSRQVINRFRTKSFWARDVRDRARVKIVPQSLSSRSVTEAERHLK
jgi:biotin carboxylase